jgi:hypothetical protein
MMKRFVAFAALVALPFGLIACSDDDGESVRDCDAASGSEADTTAASGSSADCAESASAAASGSGSGEAVCDPFGNAADADTVVNVALTEWSVTTDQAAVPAGKIHFAIENSGAEVHELVVVRAAAVAELPLDDAGVLDEAAFAEGDFVGEVEGFPAGQTCDGTFELTAGAYVLLCAIVEDHDGETENHLAEGMAVEFTVE